jgi:Flp pilus assembly pilin Flp
MTTKSLAAVQDEAGATTAEYAVCTGAGVGIAGVLFKFLTSDAGQHIISTIFEHVLKLLPF